jgi:protein arginine kinase
VFCNLAEESELQRIAEMVEDAVADIGRIQDSPLRNAFSIKLKYLSAMDREFLIERHLISRDLAERAESEGQRGKSEELRAESEEEKNPKLYALGPTPYEVIVGDKEAVSIMLNEEDHIRLQVITPGLQLRQSWEMISSIDDELGRKIDYAFSPNWGYLTACPTNVGTGLRVSVMLHIPALAAMETWGQGDGRTLGPTSSPPSLLKSVSDMGYAVRGMYGEGSQATGAFYQISNEATLGQSEEEIVDRIRSVVRQIVDRERDARYSILDTGYWKRTRSKKARKPLSRIEIEDRIFRSYGTLINARLISSREALELLSWVSLGISLGMIGRKEEGLKTQDTRRKTQDSLGSRVLSLESSIARLLVLTRPAHLQKYEGRSLDTAARDISRAAVIREKLGG